MYSDINFNEKIFTHLLVPYVDVDVDIQPITVVPADLPSGMNITAPFFRGIKPYNGYDLFDEVIRQSDHLDEREKIKWINRQWYGKTSNQH